MRRLEQNGSLRFLADERYATACLAAAMAVAVPLILWINRGTTFWIDDLALFLESPGLDLEGALRPHFGHLVLVPRVVSRVFLEVFGTDYLPFRLLGASTVVLTVGLLYTYLKRRVSAWVALAPCLVLLVFGSDFLHVIAGNAFGVLLPVSCGLGALLALERGGWRWDALACGLLCLAIASYTVSLAFLAAALVQIGLSENRWRRAWVVAIPIILYAIWFMWATGTTTSPGGQTDTRDVVLIGSWGYQSLSAVLGALSGFDYSFPGSSDPARAGPALAVLALIGAWFRLRRGSIPSTMWAALAALAGFWALGSLGASSSRPPESARYLYPGAVLVLAVAGHFLQEVRWSKAMLAGLYVVAACGIAANAAQLYYEGTVLRVHAAQVKAGFSGLEVAGENAQASFIPPPIPDDAGVLADSQSPLAFPFISIGLTEEKPTPAYREAATLYGDLGYTPEELSQQSDELRNQADSILVAALGLELTAAEPGAPHGRCRAVAGDGQVSFSLPRGGGLLESDAGGAVEIRRFSSELDVEVGELAAGQPTILRVPPDDVANPWTVTAPGTAVRVCALR